MTLGDFSSQADAYRMARPSYPSALLDLLVADADVRPGDAVAEFGAGTGIFTRLLVERGFAVNAIEPNAQMQTGNEAPQAQWMAGTFEKSGLADGSQVWAVAAQAFHWADPPTALPEIRRILRPGGLLTLVWNNRANRESEILAWTEAAIRRHVPDFDEAYRNRDWRQILESTGDFIFVKERSVQHTVPMSTERYLQLWRSHNRLNTIAGPDRFQAFLQELEAHLKQHNVQEVLVPYRCESWSARRWD